MIVGGRPATENYSFLVYTSGCTGSLIKANWVVTARHCPTPVVGARRQRQPHQRRHRGRRDPGGQPPAASTSSCCSWPARSARRRRRSRPPPARSARPPGSSAGARPARPAAAARRRSIANELNTSIVADSRCVGHQRRGRDLHQQHQRQLRRLLRRLRRPAGAADQRPLDADRRHQPLRQRQLGLRDRPVDLRRPDRRSAPGSTPRSAACRPRNAYHPQWRARGSVAAGPSLSLLRGGLEDGGYVVAAHRVVEGLRPGRVGEHHALGADPAGAAWSGW